ncbi:MAG: CoA ligase [Bacteroidetes bacterium]|nr:MAG: CoA ligase [Bacteroidota bacterium]
MIVRELIDPKSVVVVGASDDVFKPGGRTLENLLKYGYKGDIYAVNPKADVVQGVKSHHTVEELPQVECAIIAIAAKFCPKTVEVLAKEKGTRGFIILSAGFHEESEEGAKLEKEVVDIIESVGGSLIGPNCIGVMNTNYTGVFTRPIPTFNPQGADLITGSGATAVFILELGITQGISFNSVFSVGNSAQLGVEEVLEWMDETFDPAKDSKVKLLYVESVNKPEKLLKHAQSLIAKGCRIAAVKAGGSEAGSRAASSHTGALASPDVAVDALFRKAGIVRCRGRQELLSVGAIFMSPKLEGKKVAIITHAGGPAVMLTDSLSNGGLDVPPIKGEKADALLEKLFPGSSVANPIDFLATGTAEHLGYIIDACEKDFDVDAMAVIFGSPGLFPVYEVYDVLAKKIEECKKPIFPILPSIVNVADEINEFVKKGHFYFPEEVVFGDALCLTARTDAPQPAEPAMPKIDVAAIRKVVDGASNGYLAPDGVQALLDAAGIKRAGEAVVDSVDDAKAKAKELGFPLVMKVVGPVHKSDVGGVVLGVKDEATVVKEFERMMQIKDTTAILMQPMLSGAELFVGAKRDDKFGHMVLCGMGGIFIEVLKDTQAGLAPIGTPEAMQMIGKLRSVKILDGVRGQEPIPREAFAEVVVRVSALVNAAPEIMEMDLNPLLGNSMGVTAVDARIRIEKD